MKAWVLHGVGDIRYEDAEMPRIGGSEALVSVRAAGICGSDIARTYRDGAHRMPLILGHECAGEVVGVGKWVDKAWLHKRVGVFPLIPCHGCAACRKNSHEMCRQYDYLGSRRDGGFAEYVAVPARNLVLLPEGVTFEQAAMLEPLAVAIHAMERVAVAQSDAAVVCGLGTVGMLLVTLLLERGAKNVLALCNKAYQKEQAVRLGVPEGHVCNSSQEDVKAWLHSQTQGAGADVFFECVGSNETVSQAIDLAAPGGSVCLVGNPGTDMFFDKQVYWKILRNQLKVAGTWNSSFFSDLGEGGGGGTDWHYALSLLAQKKIAPEWLISHRFGLESLGTGIRMMRDKSKGYLKCMMVRG